MGKDFKKPISTFSKMDKIHASFILCFMIQTCIIVGVFVCIYDFSSETKTRRSLIVSSGSALVNRAITDQIQNDHAFETKLDKFLICPRPNTRTGSQMFDVATSLGIAHALNYTLIIRPSSLLLKYFDLNQKVGDSFENVEKISVTQWRQNTWNRTILLHNLTLSGYWRSWKYFNNVSNDIRKTFTIKTTFLKKAEQFIRSLNTDNKTLIGIHVRRGDFLGQVAQNKGRIVVNKGYILRAMSFFRQQHTYVRFIVVSNDIKWCRDNISAKDVFFSNFTEPIIDMAILSLCDHTIISTGTFSWWCGWLSRGTVVYYSDYPRPGSYLANHTLFHDDYYPPSWIGMSNGI